ncbi:MAG: tRNA lysidine(34) synthetase TilS [bacterium]|nr:tRNA lysidine(34) synthetase TilS [bacterium]
MEPVPDILHRVQTYIAQHNMVFPGQTIVVGVSGGPDSVALLDLFCRLKDPWHLIIHVAHLDHLLRPTSNEDAEFVRNLAERHDLGFHTQAFDVAALAKAEKRSLEEAGRIARHQFLDQVRQNTGANRIALAHTLSDQAETLLMRLLRGAGTTGLAGIRPIRDQTLIRPVLEISRAEIEAYVQFRNLETRIDESNTDVRFFRNKIRADLIPHLKSGYSKQVETLLARTAKILQAEDEWFEQQVQQALKPVVLYRDKRKIILDIKGLFGYHISICRRLFRDVLFGLQVPVSNIGFQTIERLYERLQKGPGKFQIGSDLSAQTTDRWLIVGRSIPAVEIALNIPGETRVDALGIQLQTQTVSAKTILSRLRKVGQTRAYFDLDALDEDLMVRNRQPGDRIQPFGMDGTQKVSRLLIDHKIPRVLRDATPLLCSGKTILWVLGLRTSRLALVTPQTQNVLEVTFKGGWHHLIQYPKRSL